MKLPKMVLHIGTDKKMRSINVVEWKLLISNGDKEEAMKGLQGKEGDKESKKRISSPISSRKWKRWLKEGKEQLQF